MDTDDLLEIKKIFTEASDEAAKKAVAQMRDFHLDNMKVLLERMEKRFESIDQRFDTLDARMESMCGR